MLQLNDLFNKLAIDPSTVIIIRHTPREATLRRILPWHAASRPDVFNAYQSVQDGAATEKALTKAAYLASFIGLTPGTAHFVGLFRVDSSRPISYDEYYAKPEVVELLRHGLTKKDFRAETLWFNLVSERLLLDYQGRLVIAWPGPAISWYRWAANGTFPISAILDQSALIQEMPDWQELVLSWAELNSLPLSWKSALSQWRAVYLITDISDEKAYIGSASGKDNLLGRWSNYAATGHGDNKQLKARNPENFMFSILQRVSPDMDIDEIVALESNWKARLLTRTLGLNSN